VLVAVGARVVVVVVLVVVEVVVGLVVVVEEVVVVELQALAPFGPLSTQPILRRSSPMSIPSNGPPSTRIENAPTFENLPAVRALPAVPVAVKLVKGRYTYSFR